MKYIKKRIPKKVLDKISVERNNAFYGEFSDRYETAGKNTIVNVIKELSLKYNIPYDEIKSICMSPIEFVESVIHTKVIREELYYPTVRVTGFGVFYCKPGKKEYFRKLNERCTNLKEEDGIQVCK